MPLKGTPTWHLHIHVQTGSCWQPGKFAGYFTWTSLELGDYPPFPPPPKKHSNFCSGMMEMHSKRPRFQNISRRHAPRRILPRNSRFQFSACKSQRTFFPVLRLLQSFCHLFKILSKTLYKALKFGQNIFLSASHIKYCINLILGEALFVHVFIFFHLQDSGRSVLNSFDFNFWWHESENRE